MLNFVGGWQGFGLKTALESRIRVKTGKLNYFKIRKNSGPKKILEVHLILNFHISAKKVKKEGGRHGFGIGRKMGRNGCRL